MWIIAYDPADEQYLQRRDEAYWPLRHGSPLKDLPALWVPFRFIPCLRAASESADLYLIHVPGNGAPRSRRFFGTDDPPDLELFETLQHVELKHVALAVEFTTQHNWSTNASQRLRILYDSVALGIPTVYALPTSGIALRGTGRRGDLNKNQRAAQKVIAPICEELVRANKPVTEASIRTGLRAKGLTATAEVETELNNADSKIFLWCRTMEDSFGTPCCTVQLPQVVGTAPKEWKYSGSQLEALWSIIKECLNYAEKNGSAPGLSSGIFEPLALADEAVIKMNPPPMGKRNRNVAWDTYHQTAGFPHGSLGVLSSPPKRSAIWANYSIHIPNIVDLFFLDGYGNRATRLSKWVNARKTSREGRKRPYTKVDLAKLPENLLARPLIVNYVVAEYGGDRDGVGRAQNVNERTYAGKLILTDVCATRQPVTAAGKPRASGRLQKDRRYVLSADLPISSAELFGSYAENARYRTWVDFADILLLDDGAFLGKTWAEKPVPIRVF